MRISDEITVTQWQSRRLASLDDYLDVTPLGSVVMRSGLCSVLAGIQLFHSPLLRALWSPGR